MLNQIGSVIISNLSIADTESVVWERKSESLIKECTYSGGQITNFAPATISSNVKLNPIDEVIIYTAAALTNKWALSIDEQEWDGFVQKQLFDN